MRSLTPVVWQEGMHLAQHHFQQQTRYFEDSLQVAVSQLFYQPFGLVGVELDAEALRNGTVSMVHARGVMPDGLAFHCPEGDALPDALEIRELFSPTRDGHVVYLTIPPLDRGTGNVGDDRRYSVKRALVHDEAGARDEHELQFGRKNLRLALEPRSLVALPLARVQRDGAGHFVYDPDFVPPCLKIAASARLTGLVARLVDMLDAKSDSMQQDRRADVKGRAQPASNDLASFWLAHAIHTSLAPLRYHRDNRGAHPEQLYLEFARLAGALCTFALDSHPRSLPSYDHERLGECFGELDRHIRSHLEVIVPSGYTTIPLTPSATSIFRGTIGDRRCLGPSLWVLGLRSSVGAAKIVRGVPQLLKVCSDQHIERLVREAYAGLVLTHLPTPPAGIAPRNDMQYFRIEQSGPCWEAIKKTAGVGIHVPEVFQDLELELRVLPNA